MPYQFYCPQGHILQGDPSQVGQPYQCPYCNSAFLVPPMEVPQQPGFPGGWPGGMAQSGYPQPGAMPVMPSMPAFPAMPGMVGPQQPMYPMPQVGPYPGQPMMPMGPVASPAAPAAAPEEPKPEEPAPTKPADEPQPAPTGRGIELNFDPNEKDALPFDMPGPESSATSEFELPPMPDNLRKSASPFEPPTMAPPGDLLHPMEFPDDDATPKPELVKILCPRGHRLKVSAAKVGKRSRCPICGEEFVVPSPEGRSPSGPPRKTQSPPASDADQADPSDDATPTPKRKPKRQPLDPKVKQTRIAWGILIGLVVFAIAVVLVFTIWH